MTVASSVARVSYSGNGSTVAFSVPFYFLEDAHLRVIIRAADGSETVQTITTDYTVAGAGNPSGGTVTMNTAPTSSEDLVILRNVPLTQITDYQANDPFPAESHERALDKLTMISQQDQDTLARALKYPETETGTPTLPNSIDRAGAYLAFDSSGNPVAGAKGDDITTLAEISTDIATLADIEDGTDATDAIQTVAGISGNVTTVAGISSNVTTVAGNTSNINTVAGDLTGDDDIGTVADNIADVQTVSGDIANVNAVAADATDIGTVATDLTGSDTIGTVAGDISNVNTVATNIANVNSVAADATDIGTVATDIADVSTVADDIANVNTVATNIADVNTAASDIDKIIEVANDLNEAVSEIDTVATNIASVQTVGDNIANVNTVAGIDSDVSTVAADSADIQAVAADGTDIGTVATNIANVNTVAGIDTEVTTLAGLETEIEALYAELDAISAKVSKSGDTMTGDLILNTTGALTLPVGTEAQRPTPTKGMFRFNDDEDQFEGYDGAAWGAVGGGNTAVVGWENQITVAEDYTITTGNNMVSAGPITIDSGFTVTVPTGSRWVVV